MAVTLMTGADGGDERGREGGRIDGGGCQLSRFDRAKTTSLQCVACHDGSGGPTVPFQMSPNGMSHPVEVDYALAAHQYAGKYASPSELPPEIPLVNGRVTCTSCHDGASREPKHVVTPAKLCYTCHRL